PQWSRSWYGIGFAERYLHAAGFHSVVMAEKAIESEGSSTAVRRGPIHLQSAFWVAGTLCVHCQYPDRMLMRVVGPEKGMRLALHGRRRDEARLPRRGWTRSLGLGLARGWASGVT